jgi:hypothetical protein
LAFSILVFISANGTLISPLSVVTVNPSSLRFAYGISTPPKIKIHTPSLWLAFIPIFCKSFKTGAITSGVALGVDVGVSVGKGVLALVGSVVAVGAGATEEQEDARTRINIEMRICFIIVLSISVPKVYSSNLIILK